MASLADFYHSMMGNQAPPRQLGDVRAIGQAPPLDALRRRFAQSYQPWGPSPDAMARLGFPGSAGRPVGQLSPGSIEAFKSVMGGRSPRDVYGPPARAPMPAPMPMPAPRQHFGNDWSGMQRAVGLQRTLNSPGAGQHSLASLLGQFGGF